MFCLAALFVMLDAQFIGVIQVLVYAGAIMVVFVFVVMLLNLGQPESVMARRVAGWRAASGGGLIGLALVAFMCAGAQGTPTAPRCAIAADSLADRPACRGRRRRRSRSRCSPIICWRSRSRACCCWSRSSARSWSAAGAARAEATRAVRSRSPFPPSLFAIGVVGVLTRRNAIIVFMCVELMLNAVNLTFVAFARVTAFAGQVFVVFVMTVAAAEAAVGLAIIDRDLPPPAHRRSASDRPAQGLMG